MGVGPYEFYMGYSFLLSSGVQLVLMMLGLTTCVISTTEAVWTAV